MIALLLSLTSKTYQNDITLSTLLSCLDCVDYGDALQYWHGSPCFRPLGGHNHLRADLGASRSRHGIGSGGEAGVFATACKEQRVRGARRRAGVAPHRRHPGEVRLPIRRYALGRL